MNSKQKTYEEKRRFIMNATKWKEIFEAFYYGVECSDAPKRIQWTTKSTTGYLYSDSTWTHFGCTMESFEEIEWLKIELTPEDRELVLAILRKIHVPGEVRADHAIIYGYRNDVDYIC